jgi:hypothetical protein
MDQEEIIRMLAHLKHHIDHLGNAEPDYKTWKQVATLTPEEVTRFKQICSEMTGIAHEMKVLVSKRDLLNARVEARSSEWWAAIYKQHNLPPGDYHITEDNKILIRPGSVTRKTGSAN